ncbi:MAG: hypothetical protein AAF654_07675 [Myxococcota bacterium]
MKRAIPLLLILAMVACGDNTSESDSNTESTNLNENAMDSNNGENDSANEDNENQNNSNENNNHNSSNSDLLPIGARCETNEECETGRCEGGSCLGARDGCSLDEVERAPGGMSWADSYSVDGRCYCATTFDHNIGPVMVDTPEGARTVMEVCNDLGPGPGVGDNPIYNDVQCGNGPANDAGDEDWCPGRVDEGEAGCCIVGPRWQFD